MLNQVASTKKDREHPRSIVSELQTAVSRSRRIYRAAFFPLRGWCAVLSFGLDPAWVLRRRTGGFRLHCQLFLMSSGSLHISVGALVFLPLHRRWSCFPCGGANYLKNALVSEHKRATSGYQRGQRWLTADPRWARTTVALIMAVRSSVWNRIIPAHIIHGHKKSILGFYTSWCRI